MAIIVCPLSRVVSIAGSRAPARIVSLLDPFTPFPEPVGFGADQHLKVKIHDITSHEPGLVVPSDDHVDEIIGFVSDWSREAPILIHCYAGISRSTATAFITACIHNPAVDEEAIAFALRAASATATPNARIVALADASLGRGGRMSKAVAAIGRGSPGWPEISEAKPFEIPSQFVSGR
jgi:predicted protein tyrosine phosphatase